jgi:hypothetical protein
MYLYVTYQIIHFIYVQSIINQEYLKKQFKKFDNAIPHTMML